MPALSPFLQKSPHLLFEYVDKPIAMLHNQRVEGDRDRKEIKMEIRNEIKSAVAKSLVESSTANKSYVRVQPTGDVTITEETSWVCSADEYYKQVPHTLSLEIPKWTRDYSGLSENEVETCVDNRFDVAQELVDDWARTIEAWIEAGNLIVTV